jgi:carbamoyltransferase|tara:strand:- start:354 stop:905 length:552 start_codon:yes stop_codon:yes gene_type:complete
METIGATHSDIAKLVSNKNIVAVFQGRSEGGPRALGNRSLLYDPRDTSGKDYMNGIKGREWFRPLAASVMKEHADEWFHMLGLEESPFMTYSFQVKEEKRDKIPSVVHVDGTCRIQTVSEEDNYHYYHIIKAFYELTGVPMVLNTSFNLAGEPIVETATDALKTVKNSTIQYLYFPELEWLVK